ncbi:hypothetical protein AURDEDRAFT_128259 [Auricularia subglabra TFB-10046 SS5]|nr:hypothetical protein AURDEDRAFT_128259 [Auricularia subglabra TFB-10046 SS5]
MLRQCPTAHDAANSYPTRPFTVALKLIEELTRVSVPKTRRMLEEEQESCEDRHPASVKVGRDVFEAFVETLGQFIMVGLNGGACPADLYGMLSTDVLWPKTTEQLFPNGVERTVDALVFWCCAESGPAAFEILASCVRLARDAVLPRLLSLQNRERIGWAMLQALSQAPVSWQGTTPPPNPPPGFRPQLNARGRLDTVDGVYALITAVGTVGPTGTSDLAHLVFGLEAAFLAAIDAAHPVRDVFSPGRREFIVCFAALLTRLLERRGIGLLDEAPTVRLLYRYTQQAARPGQPGACADAACDVRSGPGGRKLFYCNRCRAVQYCGRECQRHDWARAAVPHKLVCASLAKLRSNIPGVYAREIFQLAWDRCDFDAADIANLRKWVLATGTVSVDAL